ncbi:o-succinylbenzoate--CoA ligase [Lentibacillus saliphilus]|uniref:o-succinylbenzoate--CoA ligase n=1 Tax=Lentibacillus saliphilus TaxID=2737028 RepID=UPI001C2F74DC|nr:o-succinylbenzoate--CoA ligase [Lentibacillus saliphilus]
MSHETIPHWLTKQAELVPDATAFELATGEKVSFFELQQKSQSFARKLSQAGVKEGMHVGLLSPNHLSMAVAIHALSYLGAVAVMLNIRLTNAELSFQIEDADVEKVLVHDDLRHAASEMTFADKIQAFSDIEQLEESIVHLKSELVLNNPFTIIYTSGTTGFPKGVVHTYGNHWWSAIASALNLGLDKQDKWLCALPLFHVGGLSILLRSVIYGMPVYLLEKFEASVVNKAILEKGVTIASVVTVMLQRLIADQGDTPYPHSFRCMLLGGGPVPLPLLKAAKTLNIPVFQTYGMTETSSQIVTLSAADALEKTGSAGKPLIPAQLYIDANQGDVGDIYVKGPMVTSGYYKREQATKESFENGWLRTGDLGRLDQDGFLYIVDRRHDLIISGGENIYPSEIESVLYGVTGINEAAVVGKEDPEWGQVPVAFVVRSDSNLEQNDILDHVSRQLAGYKVPKEIYFVDALPRNATNKVMRYKLVTILDTYSNQS